MVRFVAFGIGLALFLLVVTKLFREAGTLKLDWTGIAGFIGFIVLAFYLHHITGMG